ncbi:MAG: RNA-binding cell elongation regulator Jag/EloR [Anaerolineae bacterium]
MNERTTLEIIAPSVEQALAQGLAQLGLPREAVTVEVLDAGSKGLFGLGGRQVRVRLTVNPLGGVIAPETEPTSSSGSEAQPVPQPAAPADENDPLLNITEDVVSKLLHFLRMRAQVSAHFDASSSESRRVVNVDIRGEDLGALIGRHAEVLNAFQYIASLIVGKITQQWVQLVIDVEGYRSRRERQLRQLARRVADQVVKTGRRASLEPMPAAERRIIHLELRDHPAVTTESVGEEPYRKVTIVPKQEK